MIRVGFIGAVSKEWMGGLNYFKNLLYAISVLENRKIDPIVFVGTQTDEEIKTIFRRYAHVIEHPMFDRMSFAWFVWRIMNKVFNSSFVLEQLLKKYKINVLSHSSIVGLKSCKTINWIPDFQHLHLPHMFSNEELKQRNHGYSALAQYSDAIILSSHDALNDFNSFAPQYTYKAKVLQFVSQPEEKYFVLTNQDEILLRKKYNIPELFFYLPNQFWKHKNHLIAFEAVKILKDKGIKITIVCSGHLHDYRNSEHIENLTNFILVHDLSDQIRLLGLVDYTDVFALIKFSEAVINPSLFEGWSSTVEECKSVGKNMILSDLNVHKEQHPSALFFEKNNSESLANTLETFKSIHTSDQALNDIVNQTKLFAETYQAIIYEIA